MVVEDSWIFEAIGTRWHISLPALPTPEKEFLQQNITNRIEAFDKAYSRFRRDSLVTAMSEKAATYILPEDAKPLLDLYQDIYRATDGVVTPLIGQVLVDAGYDASYSLTPKELTQPLAWGDVLTYEYPNLTLSQPALLDFGAAGKGYLVDIVAELIEGTGISEYLVDAGGDIRLKSEGDPFQIGLEHPENLEQVIGTASLSSGSICGSAGNRRAWREFTHIMNPNTLTSVEEVRAVWVVAEEARIADGISTCLFFMEPETLRLKLGTAYSFEYVVVRSDYSVAISADFPGELFLRDSV